MENYTQDDLAEGPGASEDDDEQVPAESGQVVEGASSVPESEGTS